MNNSANLDLTEGKITTKLWAFAIPLMLGNVLQQLYNLVDTWVVGKYIGENALAAVGSSYTLMTFLTSIIIGLCLGSSAFISMAFGKRREDLIKNGIYISFVIIATLTGILMFISYSWINEILNIMNVPDNVKSGMKIYMLYCLAGFARPLMEIFVNESKTNIINIGVHYLRIEGAFYIGIGILFMLYGYYRAVNSPMISVILTIISLGTRVILAYLLSGISFIGVTGIWAAIPIGWFLADVTGIIIYLYDARVKRSKTI